MNNNLLKETDLSDILDNIGIAYIYELKRGIINKLKGPQDYYEIKNVDIGFSPAAPGAGCGYRRIAHGGGAFSAASGGFGAVAGGANSGGRPFG